MEFSSQRREMLLFLTTNMAAVTSRANQQYRDSYPRAIKGNRRRLHSGKTTPGSQHQGLVVCVLVYCEKKIISKKIKVSTDAIYTLNQVLADEMKIIQE